MGPRCATIAEVVEFLINLWMNQKFSVPNLKGYISAMMIEIPEDRAKVPTWNLVLVFVISPREAV